MSDNMPQFENGKILTLPEQVRKSQAMKKSDIGFIAIDSQHIKRIDDRPKKSDDAWLNEVLEYSTKQSGKVTQVKRLTRKERRKKNRQKANLSNVTSEAIHSRQLEQTGKAIRSPEYRANTGKSRKVKLNRLEPYNRVHVSSVNNGLMIDEKSQVQSTQTNTTKKGTKASPNWKMRKANGETSFVHIGPKGSKQKNVSQVKKRKLILQD